MVSYKKRKDGYVFMRVGNKKYGIHRLVAYLFLWLDIKNKNIFACHKNDIRDDNRLENIFVWTPQDNTQDMISKWKHYTPFNYEFNVAMGHRKVMTSMVQLN